MSHTQAYASQVKSVSLFATAIRFHRDIVTEHEHRQESNSELPGGVKTAGTRLWKML